MDVKAEKDPVYWCMLGDGYIHMGVTEPGQVTGANEKNFFYGTVEEVAKQIEARKEDFPLAKATEELSLMVKGTSDAIKLADELEVMTGFYEQDGKIKFKRSTDRITTVTTK